MAEKKSFLNVNNDVGGIDVLNTFTWFNPIVYLDTFKTGRGFTFMTKPELFLYPQKPLDTNDDYKVLAYNNMCADPKFSQFITSECHNKLDELIIKQLSYEYFEDTKSNFVPIITNLCKNTELMDISTETTNSFTTRRGYNIILPTKSDASRAASTFTLRMTETANGDITKFFGLWLEYIEDVTNGTFTANPDMIKNNILDYAVSIYNFILDTDGKTIKAYGKYGGCYPTSVPYSSLSSERGSGADAELSIPFVYTTYEVMNPRILEDFNRVSLRILPSNIDNNAEDITYGSVDYTPINESSLLNKDKLFSGIHSSIVASDERDPIVYYNKPESTTNIDENNGHFYLSFGKDSMEDKRLKSIFDDKKLYDDYIDIFDND